MERICSRCHAVLAQDSQAKRCPACDGELVERPSLGSDERPAAEIDHRGIVLPRRHALGGIITPQ
jgi:hypothetical protein